MKIVFEIPAADAPKISYPAAVVAESKQLDAARRFLKHLESEDAARIFRKHGFIVLP